MTSLAEEGDLATTVERLNPPPLGPPGAEDCFPVGGGALTFFSFKLGKEACRVNLEPWTESDVDEA